MIMPHHMLAALDKANLGRLLFGDVSVEQRLLFWQAAARAPYIKDHPVFMEKDRDWAMSLPILLHGDEGPYQKKRQLLVLQWSSLWCHGCSWNSRRLICATPQALVVTGPGGAIDQLMQHITWSVNATPRSWCDL